MLDQGSIQEEQLRMATRAKMEDAVRLMQRALNHERLSHVEVEALLDCLNWVWQWFANEGDG